MNDDYDAYFLALVDGIVDCMQVQRLKVRQKVEHLLKSDSKKWSTFPKSASKVTHPPKRGKIRHQKGASKSGAPFRK